MKITKKQRNKIKRDIIKEFTQNDGKYGSLFDKQTGEYNYNGIDLEMVMQCVFNGLNKNTDKGEK